MTKYVINVDWFELMFSGPVKDITHEYRVWLSPDIFCTFWLESYSTRYYQKVFKVFMNNQEWATICCQPPKGSVINPNAFSLQLHNSRLYEVGWLELVKLFVHHFKCEYEGTTRLDIALDGHGFLAPAIKTISGSMVCVSRAKPSATWENGMRLQQFKLGNHSSDRCVQAYNKTVELKVSKKQYISDMWQRANLDMSKDVERLEVSLRNSYVKLTANYDWKRLDDFEYLASLLRTSLHKYWQFRPNKKVKNVSRLPKYDYIDWACIGGQLLPRFSASIPTEVTRLQRAAKVDYFLYLQTGQKFRAELCVEKLKNINCLEWFYERESQWKREFQKKLGKNKNGEIFYQYISEFEVYEKHQQLFLLK